MECAEIVGPSQPLRLVSRPIPEPPEEGLLLRTMYAGICHSDLHFIEDETDVGGGQIFRHRDILGDKFRGLVLGHEICGAIEKIGNRVSADCPFKLGDVVMVFPWKGCRKCLACKAKRTELCESNSGGTSDIGQGGGGGGYSNYVSLPEWRLAIKVPANIPPEVACMLPCSGLTSYNAILKAKSYLTTGFAIRGIANFLIIGVGGLGLWAMILARLMLPDIKIKLIGLDIRKETLDKALNIGADDVILTQGSPDETVAKVTCEGRNRIDAVIDYVGSAQTQEVAYKSVYKGGTVILVGLNGGEMSLSLPVTVSRSIAIQGSRCGGIDSLKQLVEMLSNKNHINFPDVEFVRLEDINPTLDRLRQGDIPGRAILKYGS